MFVTVSHSAPYGIADAPTLMDAFLVSPDIDYISPQLYTTGTEATNDMEPAYNYPWNEWSKATVPVVLSIISDGYYTDAYDQFQELTGLNAVGWVMWNVPGFQG